MESIFKKMGPAAALSLVAFTGVLNAADDAQVRNLENRVSALEQKKGANGMINPPARPVVKDGVDLFVSGEVLAWFATQDDMAYAVELNATPADNGFNEGNVRHWKGRWNAGFRLGLGYNMAHDGWDTVAYWTHFNSRGTSDAGECEACGCETSFFNPIFYPKEYRSTAGTTPIVALEAEAKKWKLNLNMVDWELGREFFVSKWLTLRPHIGLRGAWVNQKFGIEYVAGNVATPYGTLLTGANALDFESMKNHYWGVGIRAGLDTQWGLGAGWSLYGKLALSTLWGRFNVSEKAHVQNETVGTAAQVMSIRNKFTAMRPVADLALGLRYDTTFADDSWGWGIWAGWETHYFWGQNKIFKFVGDSTHVSILDENDGDLSVGGVNVGMSFDF